MGLWKMLVRFKDGVVCAGFVVMDGIRELLPRCEEEHCGNAEAVHSRTAEPSYFQPGDWRQAVLDDFALWLSQLDMSALPPPPLKLSHDLFEVLTELAALREEARRQGREQSRLHEELARLEELYREALGRLQEKTDNLVAFKRDVQESTEKASFLLFADLRDTLRRGLAEAEAASARKGFFSRSVPAIDAIREGYELALARFDRAMSQLGIEVIDTVGRPFDPRLMKAVAAQRAGEVEPGTVVEESVSGYIRGEEVLRPAQVVVAAAPDRG